MVNPFWLIEAESGRGGPFHYYGIPDRRFVTNENKARDITQQQLDKIKDEHVRMSLKLQRAFGLRREEAMKFQPSYADKGDHIQLKASWTKGGKPRTIPVRTEAQREVLYRARNLAGLGFTDPTPAKLRASTESLRGQYATCGTFQHAWAAPCVYTGEV